MSRISQSSKHNHETHCPKATLTPDEKKMNSKKISVMTSDGQKFELEEHLAMESATIKAHVDDLPDAETVLLPGVKSWEMVKVIEFFTKLRELETKLGVKFMETKEDQARFLEAFLQDEFDKDVSNENLVCLLCAVNYLEIEVLLEIMCRLMAERTKNKTLEYWRDLFGVPSDYTPEEEAKIRRDYCWAFEGSEIEEYKNDMQSTARRHESENTRVSSVPIITSTSHKAANTKSTTQPAKVYRPAAAKHSSATRGQNYSRQQPGLRWVRKN